MKIDWCGTIGIVHTTKKPYWYNRKGYYVGERCVKPKKIRKYKDVPIKEPYLSGYITLEVHEELMVGQFYTDENGQWYRCVSFQNIITPSSTLQIVSTNLGKTFSPPTQLEPLTVEM